MVFAVAGTDPLEAYDILADFGQGVGLATQQYEQGIILALQLQTEYGSKLQLTGHSLGGGIVSAASIVATNSGPTIFATTFNAAGVHPRSVSKYGASLNNATDSVTAIQGGGDPLTSLQDAPFFFSPGLGISGMVMPHSAGLVYPVVGPNKVFDHLMGNILSGLKAELAALDKPLPKRPTGRSGKYGTCNCNPTK